MITLKTALDFLEPLFITPEKTMARCSFADIPIKVSFNQSNVIFYAIPLDITTSFGKGTSKGPEAIRSTSARQIETFILDEKIDIYERVRSYDLGDLKIPIFVGKGVDCVNATLSFLDDIAPKVTMDIMLLTNCQ